MDKLRKKMILLDFVATDPLRPLMNQISHEIIDKKQYAVATDAHSVCLIQDDENHFDKIEKYPNVQGIWPKLHQGKTVNIKTLDSFFNDVKTSTYEEAECPVCDGTGEITIGKHNYYCKSCEEDRPSKLKPTVSDAVLLSIGNKRFYPSTFFKTYRILKISGIECFEIVSEIESDTKPLVIKVDALNAMFLIMPMTNSDTKCIAIDIDN